MTWQPDDVQEEQLDELERLLSLGELLYGRDVITDALSKALVSRRDEILALYPDSVGADLIREREAADEEA